MGALAGFAPSRNGLHYSNTRWPNVPDLQLPTPFGPINIGSAANGLCGGMALAVADLWTAKVPPPPSRANPQQRSAAFNYLVSRLFDSFNIPGGVTQYYGWMNTPTHDTWFGRGTSYQTINGTMPQVRSAIDAGRPCPLGLVLVHSANPGDLGLNHQVLAYGYSDDGPRTTVQIYDSNVPDRDDITISFDHTNPSATTTFSCPSVSNILGFFPVPWTPHDPGPLFTASSQWQQRPGAGQDVAVGGDGSVWVIGTNPVGGGFGIYRWTGSDWKAIDGGAVRIAVDPAGLPWVVNDAGLIYQRTPAGWQQRPGAAKDIGVGADGSVWVVGTNPTGGGFGIWHWNGSGWTATDGGAVRITVGADGCPWVVNDAGLIYQRTPTGGWQQRPGAARDIGAGADGSVWVVGTNAVGGGYGLWSWTGTGWVPADGGAVQIAVDPHGLPWVVNSGGTIYQRL